MSKNNQVLKSGMWYTISSIMIRAVAIITTPIYTGMLTTADYGKANTFNTWIDLFNVVTCLCIVYSIGRAKIDFGDKFDEYMSCLQGLSSTFAFGVLIIAVIFRNQISAWIEYEVPLVITLFAYLCISPSVEYMLQKTRYEYKYKANIIISLITCVGTIALSISLMLLFNNQRYIGKILGTILPTFIMGIFFYIRTLVIGRKFYDKEYWSYALKIGLPMIPHAFALMVLAQIDRVMIKDICGDSQVGLYTFGYSFATLLSIFTNAIGQAWLPWFNEQLNENRVEKIRDFQKKLVLLGCFLTFGFLTLAPEALMILSPSSPDYWAAKYVVPPIALGTLAQYFYTNYVNVELFMKRTPIIAVSSCMAAAINYGLNLLMIPRYGYIAAAYTTLASYIILMFFHFIATRFYLKQKVYADGFMFAMLAIMVFLGISMLFLYGDGMNMRLIRFGYALVVLGAFAFVKRNDIMLMIAFIKKKYSKKA